MDYIIIEKEDGKWDVRRKGTGTDAASNLPSKQSAVATAKGFIGNKSGHIWIRAWGGFEEVIPVNC